MNLSTESIESVLTFNPLQDLKRDLHTHFDLPIAVIERMSEDQIYSFFDDVEEEEDENPNSFFNFLCGTCKKDTKFKSIEFDDHTDCVKCKCLECGKFEYISEFFFDTLYDEED